MLLSPKGLLRLVSAGVGFMLFIVACMGFNTLKLSVYSVDSQAEFGCLCFLGVCFGLLLTFGESKWELFFFFFGFMRYRLGRACIFAVSGIMTALLGKSRDQQCNCSDNVILIIEGVALMAMAIMQTLAMFVFGNNSAPRRSKDSASTIRVPPIATPLPVTAPRTIPLPKEPAPFQAIVQPVSQPTIQAAASAPPMPMSPASHADNNLPSWMHTP
ncbi:KIF-1 binding protein [Phytophthora cinnamomi]|uniref:KIF-1 binding protein n=1 Tax=Phytophthora cinnamomi TaxID=4785 RepID=UPI00355A3950|nr:KIF-1 binding protein [Phytophthora cinnamomi]